MAVTACENVPIHLKIGIRRINAQTLAKGDSGKKNADYIYIIYI